MVVAEVFDTELIGEGALRTFKEAHGTLVEVPPFYVNYDADLEGLPCDSVIRHCMGFACIEWISRKIQQNSVRDIRKSNREVSWLSGCV